MIKISKYKEEVGRMARKRRKKYSGRSAAARAIYHAKPSQYAAVRKRYAKRYKFSFSGRRKYTQRRSKSINYPLSSEAPQLSEGCSWVIAIIIAIFLIWAFN